MFSKLYVAYMKARDKARQKSAADKAAEAVKKDEVVKDSVREERPDYRSISPMYFKTCEGISSALCSNLYRLNDIALMRRTFTKDQEVEVLEDVIIKGKFLLAGDGGVFKITDHVPNMHMLPMVATLEEFFHITGLDSSFGRIRMSRTIADNLFSAMQGKYPS